VFKMALRRRKAVEVDEERIYRPEKHDYLYVNADLSVARFNSTVLARIDEKTFKGFEETYNVGEYSTKTVTATINSLGEEITIQKITGYKEEYQDFTMNWFEYVDKELFLRLSEEEREEIKNMNSLEILSYAIPLQTKPIIETPFEEAINLIYNKAINHFVKIHSPVYEDFGTGSIEDADIIVDINGKKTKITEGTIAKSVICEEKGSLVYRFVI